MQRIKLKDQCLHLEVHQVALEEWVTTSALMYKARCRILNLEIRDKVP